MPVCGVRERADGIVQTEWRIKLTDRSVERALVEITEDHVRLTCFDLVAAEGCDRAGPETLFRAVLKFYVTGDPVVQLSCNSEVCRVDNGLGNVLADLVCRCRVTHQIAEFAVTVALLNVCESCDLAAQCERACQVAVLTRAQLYDRLSADVFCVVENSI